MTGQTWGRALVMIAALPFVSLAACSDMSDTEAADDPAAARIRDILDSRVIDQSRAQIKNKLASGTSRSELAAMIDREKRRGTISESTACVQTGLIYGLSDDEIVSDCREAMESELDNFPGG